MLLRILIPYLLFVTACGTEVPKQEVLILGHGGSGFDVANTQVAPNTLQSIQNAIELYALDGVEVDLQMTKDSVFILYHDIYLEEQTACRGKVYEKNWIELETCTYRKQYTNTYQSLIIRLEDMIDYVKGLPQKTYLSLNIQIHEIEPDYELYARTLSGLISDNGLYQSIFVESNHIGLLRALKQSNDSIKCLINSRVSELYYKQCMEEQMDGIVSHFSEVNLAWADSLNLQGKILSIYGQTLQTDFRKSRELGADHWQVDNPILAKNAK